MKKIDVLILCGGFGTRLKTLVPDMPKALARVAGKPFIELLIKRTAKYGLKRFILCTGYKSNQIRDYFEKNKDKFSGLEIIFSEEKTPLGTGGAINNARELITTDPFMVLNGDTLSSIDLGELIDFHFQKNPLLTIALSKAGKVSDSGSVLIDKNGKIIDFNEKPERSGEGVFINSGIYLISPRALEFFPKGKSSLEIDVFTNFPKGECCGKVTDQSFIDIGTPENYRKAGKFKL